MGWDVVQIGLKHNLPVHDMHATARELSRRLNINIRLVARDEYHYNPEKHSLKSVWSLDMLCLDTFKVNETGRFQNLIVTGYQAKELLRQLGQEKFDSLKFEDSSAELVKDYIDDPFELYEFDDQVNDDRLGIRIFEENVELDRCVIERWSCFQNAFHDQSERSWLESYRSQFLDIAKKLGCEQILICSDQGPTINIYDNMHWPAEKLLEYTRSMQYYEATEDKSDARLVDFQSYFDNTLTFAPDEYIDVVFDKVV